MDYDYSELIQHTKSWISLVTDEGWIDASCAKTLNDLEAANPENLLSHPQFRPLIVAFMGGTGVGKSTLLNRLANQAIAKTGLERPTSKEVTVYCHKDVQLQKLPDSLPLDKIRIATHDESGKKAVVWIDMPDFDSVEAHNKEIVMGWLPHIDLLIYVVSPERYRDNKAWRLLQSEGARHAWVFVMNQWDRADSIQLDAFKQQLGSAGFTDPLVFKTACGIEMPDDFPTLQATIETMATERTIEQLQQRGIRIRKEAMHELLSGCIGQLGTEQAFSTLTEHWQTVWKKTAQTLTTGMEWPIVQMARHYAEKAQMTGSKGLTLWDDWAQTLYEDGLDELLIQADSQNLATAPLKQQLLPLRTRAPKILHEQVELSLRQALAKPGHAMQRFFLKFLRIAEFILPLTAMGLVGYEVLHGYYNSHITHTHYLGTEFAIHSVLVIAITWLVPFYLHKKLLPSEEKTALNGLRKGVSLAFNLLEAEVIQTLEQTDKQRRQRITDGKKLMTHCKQANSDSKAIGNNDPLARMLVE